MRLGSRARRDLTRAGVTKMTLALQVRGASAERSLDQTIALRHSRPRPGGSLFGIPLPFWLAAPRLPLRIPLRPFTPRRRLPLRNPTHARPATPPGPLRALTPDAPRRRAPSSESA